MSSTIIVPPIRAPLTNPRHGTAGRRTAAPAEAQTTTRDWYLFFEKLARGLQRVNASVNQGTHEERLATAPGNVPDGALWVETDRGNVVYQVQTDADGEPQWIYLAGAMSGTLTPDQRPADLGELDAGFQFAATDTDAFYQWDGTAWVDITLLRYGTHAARLALPIAGVPKGALYIETDRGHVIYQAQGDFWTYLAGTMWGTISPDQRPADLGVHDAGFNFRGTDQQREFLWSQTAWVEITPPAGSTAQIAYATSSLILTTADTDIPGAAVVVTKSGTYLVFCSIYWQLAGAGDNQQFMLGILNVGGAQQAQRVDCSLAVQSAVPVFQQWLVTAVSGQTIKLQARKTGGTGSSTVYSPNTSISALFLHP